MQFDKKYQASKHYFGTKPERILRNFHHLLKGEGQILDIGVGQGRNTFFLAKKGYHVDAIDPSRSAIEIVSEKANRKKLPIRTFHSDFESFSSEKESYSGILIFGVMQLLSWDSINKLVGKIKNWISDGGIIYTTAFLTIDPSFTRYAREWKEIGRNSFSNKDEIRTFFDPGEIVKIFREFSVIHFWEGMGPEHRHGDGPLHKHGKVEAVFQKC